jgi:hypothetical protein
MPRVGQIRVYAGVLSESNAASAAPSSATNGIEIPVGTRGQYSHLLVSKSTVAQFAVWGMTSPDNAWYEIDRFSMASDTSEAQLIQHVGSFTRVCEQRLDANVSALGVNTSWGLSEE